MVTGYVPVPYVPAGFGAAPPVKGDPAADGAVWSDSAAMGAPARVPMTAPGQWTPAPYMPTPGWQDPAATSAQGPAQYTAPASTPAIGTTGIEFGGGQFQWQDLGGGVYGYRAPDGRTFDSAGTPHQPQPMAQGQQQPAQPASPGAAYTQTGPAGLQAAANPLVDWFKTHNGVNVSAYNFGKMKSSTQDLVLGAAEAAGHDKNDVLQDIQRTLPRATGPRTGYVAPLGTR
jgi:hypothetical protein